METLIEQNVVSGIEPSGKFPDHGGFGSDAVVVEGLTKRYGDRTAVDRLSFTVPTGSVAGLIGPNGAGKTTLMAMLLGLVRRSEGSGTVLGRSIDRPHSYLARVGASIEGPAFHRPVSGIDNLRALAVLGGCDQAEIPALIERVGLTDRGEDRNASYSMGMKQRLAIAASLLGDPELVILDEPPNGLDALGMQDIRRLISEVAAGGHTVIVSSHLLSELEQVCDWLIVIDDGGLAYLGRDQPPGPHRRDRTIGAASRACRPTSPLPQACFDRRVAYPGRHRAGRALLMTAAFRSELLLLNRLRIWAVAGLVTVAFTAATTALLITTAEPAAQVHHPNCWTLIGGKMASLMVVTATLVLVGLATGAATSAIVAPGQDIDTTGWFGPAAFENAVIGFARTIGWAFAWALIATTLAVLVRSVPIALGIGVLWFGPIENVIGNEQELALRWFPGLLLQQVVSASPNSGGAMSTGAAVTTLAAYALAMAVIVIVVIVVFRRLDVTS